MYPLFFQIFLLLLIFYLLFFGNSDLGFMLFIIAKWVLEGVIFSIAYSVKSYCVLMVYGALSLSLYKLN